MQKEELHQKYNHYRDQGHFVLGVTLSTYIKSECYAHSDKTRHLWDQHFIRRVLRRLPCKARLDHDYVMERSPEGFWHYHGLLAVSSDSEARLWKHDALHPQLNGDVASFKKAGQYRPFRINSFLIEPVKNLDSWCNYITKQQRSMPRLNTTVVQR